jgi:hypothetical protein
MTLSQQVPEFFETGRLYTTVLGGDMSEKKYYNVVCTLGEQSINGSMLKQTLPRQ